MDPHYYNVGISWNTGRKGVLSSPELPVKIEVATPPPFSMGVENVWSPEHLLTAAVNSCFMTTFLAIAENSKLEFTHFNCSSQGKLDQVDGKFLMTEIFLEPVLIIKNSADKERAERILQKSEAACLISNSIRSKVTITSTINY